MTDDSISRRNTNVRQSVLSTHVRSIAKHYAIIDLFSPAIVISTG